MSEAMRMLIFRRNILSLYCSAKDITATVDSFLHVMFPQCDERHVPTKPMHTFALKEEVGMIFEEAQTN